MEEQQQQKPIQEQIQQIDINEEELKEGPDNWHDPETLFCHARFTSGQCTKRNDCKFKHELFQKKYSPRLPQGICPNGVKCPINHRKVKCPIEKQNGSCHRETRIKTKTFKCEYKHKKPESQTNQKKAEKNQKMVEKHEQQEEQKQQEKIEKMEIEGNDQQIQEVKHQENERQQQKKIVEQKFRIFKIPKVTEGADSTVCGVLDQSGSMSSGFKYLARNWNKIIEKFGNKCKTLIFHNHARQEQGLLSENPDWGGTHIESGFQLLNDVLENQETSECITVIFVSDGGDNNTGTINQRIEQMRDRVQKNIQQKKRINFLCVGVGSGFPTFLAMKIRDVYHQGEQTVPPVFLVESPYTEQDWNTQFALLQEFLKHNQEIETSAPVRLFPWDQESTKTYENTFVLADNSIENIQIQNNNNETIDIKEFQNFTMNDIVEIGRTFLNSIQVRSLNKNVDQSLLKKQAKQAYDIISDLKNVHLDSNNKKLTFKQKVEIRYNSEILNQIIRNLRELSTTNVLSGLSEAEAAKRLAIGTTVGKYHEQALKLAGLTVDEFQQARDEFVDILQKKIENKEIQESEVGEQGQSFMSLMNQKEVFCEEGFIEGLKMIKNQYDLVEMFPLVGQSVFIRRTDGSMINPYLVSVQDILRLHSTIDSVSLLQAKNEIEVSAGEGGVEVINAVLPIFTEKDQDIDFFLRSKLFSILMTFNVCSNVDTCLDQAYFALLCNAVINLMNQKPSQWKEEMLQKILYTIHITYSKNKSFKEYQKQLIENPQLAMVTEVSEKMALKIKKPETKDLKCEDLSKALTHLMYLKHFEKKEVSEENISNIYLAIFQEAIGRFIPRNIPLVKQLEFSKKEEIQNAIKTDQVSQKILKEQKDKFSEENLEKNFFTKYSLLSAIEKSVNETEIELPEFDIQIPETFMKQGKLNMLSLKHIFKYLFSEQDKKLNWKTTLKFVFFGYYFKNSADRYLKKNKIFTFEKAHQLLQEGKVKNIIFESKQNIIKQLEKQLVEKFEEQVQKSHQKLDLCLPLTPTQIAEIEGIKVNKTSGLPTNVCICQTCPHYLKVNPQLSQHLESTIRIPAFYKACQSAALKSDVTDAQLFQQIIELHYVDENQKKIAIPEKTLAHMLENQNQYIEYIKQLRHAYAKMQQ